MPARQISQQKQSVRDERAYLSERISDLLLLDFPNVQAQNPPRVNNERYDAGHDQDSDEDRGKRVKTGPSCEFDENCRYDDTNTAKCVLDVESANDSDVA